MCKSLGPVRVRRSKDPLLLFIIAPSHLYLTSSWSPSHLISLTFISYDLYLIAALFNLYFIVSLSDLHLIISFSEFHLIVSLSEQHFIVSLSDLHLINILSSSHMTSVLSYFYLLSILSYLHVTSTLWHLHFHLIIISITSPCYLCVISILSSLFPSYHHHLYLISILSLYYLHLTSMFDLHLISILLSSSLFHLHLILYDFHLIISASDLHLRWHEAGRGGVGRGGGEGGGWAVDTSSSWCTLCRTLGSAAMSLSSPPFSYLNLPPIKMLSTRLNHILTWGGVGWGSDLVIIAVVSIALYLTTDKGEHTALYKINNNVYIKTSKIINYIVIIINIVFLVHTHRYT